MSELTGIRLIGGPYDGATMDLNPRNEKYPRSGELKFGGLVYWLDLDAGTATYVSGRLSPERVEELHNL